MRIAVGQRWLFHDSRYTWVIEVTHLPDHTGFGHAKIIQVIKGPTEFFRVGSDVFVDAEPLKYVDFYTFLEGQEAPQG